MNNISAAIGWKFNNQPGMATENGVITEFPNGIPSQASQDLWIAEYKDFLDKQEIRTEIINLESSVTPRNYREFVMGDQYSIDKINKVEAQISALRAKL